MSNADNVNQQIQELLRELIKNHDVLLEKFRKMTEEQKNSVLVSTADVKQSDSDQTLCTEGCLSSAAKDLPNTEFPNNMTGTEECGVDNVLTGELNTKFSSFCERKEVTESTFGENQLLTHENPDDCSSSADSRKKRIVDATRSQTFIRSKFVASYEHKNTILTSLNKDDDVPPYTSLLFNTFSMHYMTSKHHLQTDNSDKWIKFIQEPPGLTISVFFVFAIILFCFIFNRGRCYVGHSD